MQEPGVLCNACHYTECCCKNLKIINKRYDAFCKVAYMKKLEKYFGIEDTDYIKHSVSLKRISNFKYKIIIKQLTVYNPLKTYIKEMPRDINNLIYSYLWRPNLITRISITLPRNYPFDCSNWKVIKYMKNGKNQDTYKETMNARCIMKSISMCMTIEKEILAYITKAFDYEII
jgi:hypothetical protein